VNPSSFRLRISSQYFWHDSAGASGPVTESITVATPAPPPTAVVIVEKAKRASSQPGCLDSSAVLSPLDCPDPARVRLRRGLTRCARSLASSRERAAHGLSRATPAARHTAAHDHRPPTEGPGRTRPDPRAVVPGHGSLHRHRSKSIGGSDRCARSTGALSPGHAEPPPPEHEQDPQRADRAPSPGQPDEETGSIHRLHRRSGTTTTATRREAGQQEHEQTRAIQGTSRQGLSAPARRWRARDHAAHATKRGGLATCRVPGIYSPRGLTATSSSDYRHGLIKWSAHMARAPKWAGNPKSRVCCPLARWLTREAGLAPATLSQCERRVKEDRRRAESAPSPPAQSATRPPPVKGAKRRSGP
jgi:hypothetical protein